MSNTKDGGNVCKARNLFAESVFLSTLAVVFGVFLVLTLNISYFGLSAGIETSLAFLSSRLGNPFLYIALYALPILVCFGPARISKNMFIFFATAILQIFLSTKLCFFTANRFVVALHDASAIGYFHITAWLIAFSVFAWSLLYSASLVFAVDSLFLTLSRKESCRPSTAVNI